MPRVTVILIMTVISIDFTNFIEGYDEFEEMSLDSKYNKMKKLTNLLTDFKNLEPKKTDTQLKKERILKNVDQLYKKYYNVYKNDYDADEVNEGKKKEI